MKANVLSQGSKSFATRLLQRAKQKPTVFLLKKWMISFSDKAGEQKVDPERRINKRC